MRWQFPDEVQRPVLLGTGGVEAPDLVLALAADDLAGAGDWARHVLRKRLEQIDGVARAQVVGEPRREIRVIPDPDALAFAGVSVQQISAALAAANVPATGGLLRRRGVRYSLRLESALASAEEIRDVIVTRTDGRPIRVGDLARVEDGFEVPEGWSRLDGRPAVGVLVYREAGANLVTVAGAVRERLAEVDEEFPDFQVELIVDPSPFVEQSISGVGQAVWVGALLAFAVLVIFLREFRSPLFLIAALPVSVIAGFTLFDLFGVSLNLMSLGGMALGVGMLVDNSIICLENIHRLRGQGLAPREAAAQGAREVAMPIPCLHPHHLRGVPSPGLGAGHGGRSLPSPCGGGDCIPGYEPGRGSHPAPHARRSVSGATSRRGSPILWRLPSHAHELASPPRACPRPHRGGCDRGHGAVAGSSPGDPSPSGFGERAAGTQTSPRQRRDRHRRGRE